MSKAEGSGFASNWRGRNPRPISEAWLMPGAWPREVVADSMVMISLTGGWSELFAGRPAMDADHLEARGR